MKKLFVLTAMFIGITACEQVDFLSENQSSPLSIEGTWKLIAYQDYNTNHKIEKDSTNSFGGMDVLITFSSDVPADYEGINTTNSFNGKFNIDKSRLLMLEYHETSEALEPQWGKLFTENITSVTRYEISGDILILKYAKESKGMIFQKVE